MHLLPKGENSRQFLPVAAASLKEILRAPKNMTSPETGTGTPFPLRWLAGGLLLTVVVLLAMLWFAFDSLRNVTTVQLLDLRLQELSGSLRAQSDGIDLGATFTLELPLTPEVLP